jgi:hypothetical protein
LHGKEVSVLNVARHMDGFAPICSCCRNEVRRLKYFCPARNQVYCSDACAAAAVAAAAAPPRHDAQLIGFGSHLTTMATLFKSDAVFHQTHQYITQLAVERLEADNGWRDFFAHLQGQSGFPLDAAAAAARHHLSARRLLSGNLWSEAPIHGGHRMNLLTRVSRESMQAVLNRYPRETAGIMVASRFRYNMRTWPLVASLVWQNGIYAVDRLLLNGCMERFLPYDYHFICPPELAEESLATTVHRSCRYLTHRFRQALVQRDLFWLGAALHTIQDSYARGHVIRRPGATPGAPSVIECVQRGTIFGDERDFHTREDSMRAFAVEMDPRLRAELIASCAHLLLQFHDTLLRMDAVAGSEEKRAVRDRAVRDLEQTCNEAIFYTSST